MAQNALQVIVLGAMMLIGVGVLVGIGSSVTTTISDGLYANNVVTSQNITISAATNNTAIRISNGDVATITALYNGTYTFTLPGNGTITSHSREYGTYFTPTISCGQPGNCSIAAATSTNFQLNFTAAERTTASNAATNSTSGVLQLSTQLPNVGLVLGASTILAIIFGVLFTQFRNSRRE